MTKKYAIEVEHLTKIYKIYNAPIDRLKESLHPFRKRYSKDFYALNDVSFKIQKGETVGIIGKNGAGKSTLLKILTGVLTPTTGSFKIKGKIASLLELGAGFNPEMTGLENIYLNGTIMGYSKTEMDRKLDSIVQFADIGEFIYQPVKMYSSGMFARLAFSVAINVEPEILIVDEALSVGDFMFQFKCLQKFKELKEKQVTILFVSHSVQQIISTCNRAIFLHLGNLKEDSYDVEKTVFHYENIIRNVEQKKIVLTDAEDILADAYDFDTSPNTTLNEYRFGSHQAIIRKVVLDYGDKCFDDMVVLKAGKRIVCKLLILAKDEIKRAVCGISIKNIKGEVLWGANTTQLIDGFSLNKGKNTLKFEFQLNIVPGEYLLFVGIADISGSERIELDQRWPVKKFSIVSNNSIVEGYVYSPVTIEVENQ